MTLTTFFTFARRRHGWALGALSLALLTPVAHAALGGAPTLPASAATSATVLKSATAGNAATTAAYTVREQTLPNGVTEREFVTGDGVVFGIAWHGPFQPDLRNFMGDDVFQRYAAAIQAAQGDGRRGGPVSVETDGVVAQAGGHQRAFSGRAYVVTLVPAGVDASVVR